jgi:hypothetical protein
MNASSNRAYIIESGTNPVLALSSFWNIAQKSEISLGVNRKFLITLLMFVSTSGRTIFPPILKYHCTAYPERSMQTL